MPVEETLTEGELANRRLLRANERMATTIADLRRGVRAAEAHLRYAKSTDANIAEATELLTTLLLIR